MFVVVICSAVLLAGLFAIAGGLKFIGHDVSAAERKRLGISMATWKLISLPELMGAFLVLYGLRDHWFGIPGAVMLGVVAVGGLVTHIRRQDRFVRWLPAIVGISLVVVYVISRLQTVPSILVEMVPA